MHECGAVIVKFTSISAFYLIKNVVFKFFAFFALCFSLPKEMLQITNK